MAQVKIAVLAGGEGPSTRLRNGKRRHRTSRERENRVLMFIRAFIGGAARPKQTREPNAGCRYVGTDPPGNNHPGRPSSYRLFVATVLRRAQIWFCTIRLTI